MKVLVAYATRHGATRGIAERIAAIIERPGIAVDIRPVAEAREVEAYDAFVIGSAAYMGGWLGDATAFVRHHRSLLASRPTWLFSSGPVGREPVNAKGQDQPEASEPKEFAEFTQAIGPRDERVFFGAYDPDAPAVGAAEKVMTGVMRLLPAARQALPAGDFRDWPAIEAWAEEIAMELGSAGALVPA